MCDYEDVPMKSTDDFYTYNDREPFTPGEIDGYDDSQDAWGFDPFGPDADIWQSIAE